MSRVEEAPDTLTADEIEKHRQLIQQDQKFRRTLSAAIRSGGETAAGVTATVRIGRRG